MSVLLGPWWKWSTENQTNPAYAPTTAYYLKEHPSRRLFCVDVTEMDPTLCATELSIEWNSNRINEDKSNNGERETGQGKRFRGSEERGRRQENARRCTDNNVNTRRLQVYIVFSLFWLFLFSFGRPFFIWLNLVILFSSTFLFWLSVIFNYFSFFLVTPL